MPEDGPEKQISLPSSSLPISLIQHLYATPRDASSLPLLPSVQPYIRPSIADDRQQPSVPADPTLQPSSSPHRSDGPTLFSSQSSPNPPRLPPIASLLSRNISWGEGEAGPSSLIHSGDREYDSRYRRDASQPARATPPPNTFGYGSTSRELHRRDTEYYTFSDQLFHDRAISPLPPLLVSMEAPLSSDRRDTFSYPQVGSLSISDPNYLRQVSTPELEPSYGSEPVSVNIGSNEGGDASKNKKRRAHSMDVDDIPKKTSRKTAVACNFCRGRKLRCNGAKPSCYNCTVRKFECEYVSTQRRRGPGKAPKGSRSRKGRSEQSGSSSNIIGDRLPTMVPDYDVSPDLRPYISVLSLDTFEFQPPDPSPQYRLDPEPLMRRQGSRSRTSRSRETSSAEDHLDTKDIHRNQSGS